MNKRAQILIFSLWVLVILTFLALGIGQRMALALRLSRYQRDKFKASCLARAGLNIALSQLLKKDKDTHEYNGKWLQNDELFKKIIVSDDENEFATVSYAVMENNQKKDVFGILDEESKININTASKELCLALLEQCKIDAADELANNILIWRGDMAAPADKNIYEALGYLPKAAKFTNIEELRLVKGVTDEVYQKLKPIITVYGDTLFDGEAIININTASQEVLTLFMQAIAKRLGITQDTAVKSLAEKINNVRTAKGPFKAPADIGVVTTGSDEENIFNNLKTNSVFQPNFFLIEVIGNVGKIKSRLKAIYNRQDNKILYWHES